MPAVTRLPVSGFEAPLRLRLPSLPRALVLIAHPDITSRSDAGHAFVADVLHAHQYATLPFSLLTAHEQASHAKPPGMVQSKLRVRAMFESLAAQPELRDMPLALIGIGEAAQGCIAAAARLKLPRLTSLVLLDGRTDQVPHHLVRLNVPTLFVMGQADARRQALQRAATRDMAARHRTEVLRQRTAPRPARGALEAFACVAVAWLDDNLGAQKRAAGTAQEVQRKASGPSGMPSTQACEPQR